MTEESNEANAIMTLPIVEIGGEEYGVISKDNYKMEEIDGAWLISVNPLDDDDEDDEDEGDCDVSDCKV